MSRLNLLWMLVISAPLLAQELELPTSRLADPTELYANLNITAGLNFDGASNFPGYEIDGWEFRLQGDLLAFDKLRFRFTLPVSNQVYGAVGVFDNAALDIGFQTHNTQNFFKSSLLEVGITTPLTDDRTFSSFSRKSWELRARYTAALRLENSWMIYPSIGFYQRNSRENYTYVPAPLYPSMNKYGLRTMVLSSYETSDRSFIQFGLEYENGFWFSDDQNDATEEYLDDIDEHNYRVKFKFQYALTGNHHLYLDVDGYWQNSRYQDVPTFQRHISWYRLGYLYLID
ncbi:hypothetical protein [Phaeocystidibacter luteus]|uniref:DUF1207 domain-containing protein n=1 Tax=Phaeocystidibacter luteus TaxID=911197 RepID=A0A6N6RJR7_9FLAO|nr:hypothetical protein [Phaeocystidibacter luteus]KAB2813920.1 hypothetical protein F8C67_04340 [Phaeocystidibacter luteus]